MIIKIVFQLKDAKSEKPTLIYAHCNYGYYYLKDDSQPNVSSNRVYRKMVVSTKEKILPKDWNSKKYRPTKGSNLTTKLANIETELIDLCKNNVGATPKQLKDLYNNKEEKNKTKPLTLSEYAQKLYEGMKEGDVLIYGKNPRPYTKGSIKAYTVFKSALSLYEEYKKETYTFEQITLNGFYEPFIKWMMKTKEYRPNTMGNIIKNLKSTMERAAEEKLHVNFEYRSRKFAKPGAKEVFNIALTLEEILSLYKLDLSNNTLQDDVRDLFLIGVETAQRFSDYSKITKDMIESNYISLYQQKTKTLVDIPMSDLLKRILQKRNYVVPSISSTMLNKEIKKIAFKAGIRKVEKWTEKVGTENVDQKETRYNLISSHTARRTGSTLLYMSNAGIIETMLITGHQAQKELLNYIKLPKGYNRAEAEKVDFYNKLKKQNQPNIV